MSTAWRWCSPACATSGIDAAARHQPQSLHGKLRAPAFLFHTPIRAFGANRPLNQGAHLSRNHGMKILVIGSGGREHALAWKLKQSPRVSEVIVAPGNAGTAIEAGVRNAPIAATDIDALLHLAQVENVALTVVGPRRRWSPVSSTASGQPACAVSARTPRPLSSKARKPSPRTSLPVTASRPRTTPCSPNSHPRSPTCVRKAHRS